MRAIQNSLALNQKIQNFLVKRRQLAETLQDRNSDKTRWKNKRGGRKGETYDSPEIPDRSRPSDIPGLSSGINGEEILGFKQSL